MTQGTEAQASKNVAPLASPVANNNEALIRSLIGTPTHAHADVVSYVTRLILMEDRHKRLDGLDWLVSELLISLRRLERNAPLAGVELSQLGRRPGPIMRAYALHVAALLPPFAQHAIDQAGLSGELVRATALTVGLQQLVANLLRRMDPEPRKKCPEERWLLSFTVGAILDELVFDYGMPLKDTSGMTRMDIYEKGRELLPEGRLAPKAVEGMKAFYGATINQQPGA